ncbi:MAG: hypothetical protein H0W94_02880 [Actinobacteria bacterium]|nr:hypothetical protein [Actinomycetota bacterium]
MSGGAGADTATYPGTAAVTVNLSVDGPQDTAGAGTDTLDSVANLTGSSGGDSLTGNAGSNVLLGVRGNDNLFGLAGTDTLTGGARTDTADEGGGIDSCTGETESNCET